jgi:hypothetical protein
VIGEETPVAHNQSHCHLLFLFGHKAPAPE